MASTTLTLGSSTQPPPLPLLLPDTVRQVWSDPSLLAGGLGFALPALLILLVHELGHFLACRFYGLRATPPYFVPAPLLLGTFGAFIRIHSPIRGKRVLFDVGVAGPLAGFVALLPFLVLGVAWSSPSPIEIVDPSATEALLLLPGRSLAVVAVSHWLHGPLPAGMVLDPHPFALAAWFGLFATALNLIPLGQLDGGHLLYAVAGRMQRRLAVPLLVALAAAGILWPGWLVWCVVVLILGLRHPPVRDEAAPLGRGRRLLSLVALAVFVLSFMPVPLEVVAVVL